MTIICGIEEAGRGPVIGPLVMVGLTIDEKDEEKLRNIGAKDSKLLTPLQRENLFEKIIAIAKDYKVIIISPQQIDACLNDPNHNLNWLEADNTVKLINELKPDKVIIDCPSNNIKAYTEYIKEKLDDKKIEVIAEHKADVNYPVVSASSIIAKVTRDSEIEKIKNTIKVNFGSGYPSDPKTVSFLSSNWNNAKYTQIFRKTWESYKRLERKKSQSKLTGF